MESKSKNESGGESEPFSQQFKKPALCLLLGLPPEHHQPPSAHTQSFPFPLQKALETQPLSCCCFQGFLVE